MAFLDWCTFSVINTALQVHYRIDTWKLVKHFEAQKLFSSVFLYTVYTYDTYVVRFMHVCCVN